MKRFKFFPRSFWKNRLSRNAFQPMITQILKGLHRFFRRRFNWCNQGRYFYDALFWKNKWKVWGFTLMEILIVVAILGALVSLGVPNYNRTIERAIDQEARTNLLLIQAAEKIYHSENNVYYPPGSSQSAIASINSALHLNLNENQWDYIVGEFNGGFTATALRDARGFSRTYLIDEATTAPVQYSGTFP